MKFHVESSTFERPSMKPTNRHRNNMSFKAWIMLHTLLIMLPMFLSVTYVAHEVDKTSRFSIDLNNQILRQTKSIRWVLQRTADVERKAKLFMVLSDPALGKTYELESYEATRASMHQELNELLQSPINNQLTLLINELAEKEAIIYQLILSPERHGSEKLIDSAFSGLRESSNILAREFESFVDQQSRLILKQSQTMTWLFLTIGAALSLIALWSIVTLSRAVIIPIRDIHRAIQGMLSGDFDRRVNVRGPAELCRLAQSLESLRLHWQTTARHASEGQVTDDPRA